jgi:predicted pyridoxine 5'-phosphate oxidase superfamily flavin-nucleotide-binding protein
MAKKIFDQIESEHRSFIERQHIFFVATAASEGRVNVAPKGMDTLRVVDPNRIIWLNRQERRMKPQRTSWRCRV